MTPAGRITFTSVIVGGIAAIGLGAWRLLSNTTTALKNAVAGVDKTGAPVLPMGSGVTVPVRITGYWPFVQGLSTTELRMEGGHNDRKGKPLHTLEDFQAGKAPFVSVSGDYEIFPYGQRISLAEWPGVVFRIVDTGSHFHGAGKIFRLAGREPLDVCVASPSTKVIAETDATIYAGDHFEKGTKDVALAKVGKPTATVGDDAAGFDMLGAELS